MAEAPSPDSSSSAWATWLSWGWVALLLAATVAELTGWGDLRLALDFQRAFR